MIRRINNQIGAGSILNGQVWTGAPTDPSATQREDEFTIITDAYVNAHYGQVPDPHDEIQRLRDCWERARSRESSRRSQRSDLDE